MHQKLFWEKLDSKISYKLVFVSSIVKRKRIQVTKGVRKGGSKKNAIHGMHCWRDVSFIYLPLCGRALICCCILIGLYNEKILSKLNFVNINVFLPAGPSSWSMCCPGWPAHTTQALSLHPFHSCSSNCCWYCCSLKIHSYCSCCSYYCYRYCS